MDYLKQNEKKLKREKCLKELKINLPGCCMFSMASMTPNKINFLASHRSQNELKA